MNTFENRVAVVTGAASGIGLALVERCLQEGMRVVLADIDATKLAEVTGQLAQHGTASHPSTYATTTCDVTRPDSVQALADFAYDTYGQVDLLFSNAGVIAGGNTWETELSEYEWVMQVNFFGMLSMLRAFTPRMLAQDSEAHIVITASIAGLLANMANAAYAASKHAAVALATKQRDDLAALSAKIDVSALCPGGVNTNFIDSAKHRPAHLAASGEAVLEHEDMLRTALAQATPAAEIADQVFNAIRHRQFWILTHPELNTAVREHAEQIIAGS